MVLVKLLTAADAEAIAGPMQTEIDGLTDEENGVPSMLSRISDLEEQDFSGLSSRVSAAEGNISNLQSAVTMQQGIYQALDVRLGNVEMQKATKAYVDQRFTTLIGTAPANLDTLQEISFQLAADESVAAGLVTNLATKAAQSDLTALATRVTAAEGTITSNTGSISSLATRVTNAESAASTLSGRVTANEGDITSLKSRATALESGVGSFSVWKSNKAAASPDVSTSVSVPTAVITLGLNCPTVAGLNSLFSTVMAEVNGIKAILRGRDILAAA